MGEEGKEEKEKKKSHIGKVMGVPIENVGSISGVPIKNIASINGVPIKHEKEEEEEKEEEFDKKKKWVKERLIFLPNLEENTAIESLTFYSRMFVESWVLRRILPATHLDDPSIHIEKKWVVIWKIEKSY